jgi:hypothetical protein
VQRKRSKALAPTLDIIRKNAVHTSLKAVDASRVCPHDTPPSLSHLEASRAVLGLAAAARGATAAEGDESGIPKMPLIGRARSGVVRPDQGQKVTGLGGSQAKTNKQYSGQIQAILAAAPPSEP